MKTIIKNTIIRNTSIKNKIVKLIIPIMLVSITACNETSIKQPINSAQPDKVISNELVYSDSAHSVRKVSDDKKYITTLYSELHPLRVGKVHSWVLEVKAADGSDLDVTKIYVHGGMPIHQHGFPTRPRITESLGNGKYRVEGVKFSMPGIWEIRFNIKEKVKRDRVVFKVKV